jgi:5'-nucleotidase
VEGGCYTGAAWLQEEVELVILLTNDDGIYAKGLWALAEELQKVEEVMVVAPDREQSAIGTAVTLHQPLRVREIRPPVAEVKAYSVEGTPADSVILALEMLAKNEVSMVFSGINEGANLGDDVLLSGTVGAALQGYFHKLPAITLSVASWQNVYFDVAAKLGGLLASKIAANSFPQGILLNVNLPNMPLEEIKGVEITRLGQRNYDNLIKPGHDGKREYYWIVRGNPHWNMQERTDIWAIEGGKISITPLQSDLSHNWEASFFESLHSSILQELW